MGIDVIAPSDQRIMMLAGVGGKASSSAAVMTSGKSFELANGSVDR
jgi:hypothetical protein